MIIKTSHGVCDRETQGVRYLHPKTPLDDCSRGSWSIVAWECRFVKLFFKAY